MDGGNNYKYALCEIYAKKILPAVKLYIAVRLVKDYGYTQLEASRLLGVKQPLVNYMLSGKRKPKYIDLLLSIEEFKKIIDEVVSEIVSNKLIINSGNGSLACYLCKMLKDSSILPEVLARMGYSSEEIYIPSAE
ncbi:MAG: transcriptional regulator [Thermoprotei archaeon]